MDVVKAEQELIRFINSRAQRKGRAEANLQEERLKAEDRRKAREQQEHHRQLWCEHLRRLAAAHLQIARDARSRARKLQNGDAA